MYKGSCCGIHIIFNSMVYLTFLPRLVDAKLPRAIEAGVREGLSSPLLLPPLASRMSLLYTLLPKSPEDWGQLSRGQVILYNFS